MNEVMTQDLRSLLSSEQPDPLRREYEWALSELVTGLVAASSRSRSYGFADGFDYYELRRCGPGALMLKGLMHWTEGPRGWVDPIVVKLRLSPSTPAGFGFRIHFGAAEEPTIVCYSPAHRRLLKEILLATTEDMSRQGDWAFTFGGDEGGSAA